MSVVTTDLLHQDLLCYDCCYDCSPVPGVTLYQEFTILDDLLYQELLCYDCCYN